jgi:hypothetical protein
MSASFLSTVSERSLDAERERSPDFAAFCTLRSIDGYGSRASAIDCGNEGCGLEAARQIDKDEVIVSVPLSAALMARPLDYDGLYAELFVTLAPTHALALALCIATAEDAGQLSPWLKFWPQNAAGGWGFGAAEWSALDWCHEAVSLHESQLTAARKAFDEKIAPHLARGAAAGCSGPSWERFVWALSMVSSRAADLVVNGESRLAIIPLVDLLNHRMTPSCFLSFDPVGAGGAGAFVIRAYEPIAAGGALTICYGEKENAHLLVSYGFAQRANPFDTASVNVHVPVDHVMLSAPRQLWPNGLWPMISRAASSGIVMGALRWDWDTSMLEERPVDLDDDLVLLPEVHSDLALVVALSRAKDDTSLLGAIMSWSAGCGASPDAEAAEAIRLLCVATLATLPDALPSLPLLAAEAQGPIGIALEARRALLQAASHERD